MTPIGSMQRVGMAVLLAGAVILAPEGVLARGPGTGHGTPPQPTPVPAADPGPKTAPPPNRPSGGPTPPAPAPHTPGPAADGGDGGRPSGAPGHNAGIPPNDPAAKRGAPGATTSPDPTQTRPRLAPGALFEQVGSFMATRPAPVTFGGQASRSETLRESAGRDSEVDRAMGLIAPPIGRGAPPIGAKQAVPQVRIPDGGTVVGGGLRQDSGTKRTERAPWIDRIPFLGWLFKNNLADPAPSELLVFLTAKIVEDPGEAPASPAEQVPGYLRPTTANIGGGRSSQTNLAPSPVPSPITEPTCGGWPGPSGACPEGFGVAVDPGDGTVYIGGASGGVWKTTNFLTSDPTGPMWVPLTDFGPTYVAPMKPHYFDGPTGGRPQDDGGGPKRAPQGPQSAPAPPGLSDREKAEVDTAAVMLHDPFRSQDSPPPSSGKRAQRAQPTCCDDPPELASAIGALSQGPLPPSSEGFEVPFGHVWVVQRDWFPILSAWRTLWSDGRIVYEFPEYAGVTAVHILPDQSMKVRYRDGTLKEYRARAQESPAPSEEPKYRWSMTAPSKSDPGASGWIEWADSASRWGDYSMTSMDPADDCTFYHASEYLGASGSAPWGARVGAGACTGPSRRVPHAPASAGGVDSAGTGTVR